MAEEDLDLEDDDFLAGLSDKMDFKNLFDDQEGQEERDKERSALRKEVQQLRFIILIAIGVIFYLLYNAAQ